MSTPAWVTDILRGGLPAVLDFGTQQPATVQTPTPEVLPPVDNTGRDNANMPSNFINTITQSQVLVITFGVVALIGAVYVIRKM